MSFPGKAIIAPSVSKGIISSWELKGCLTCSWCSVPGLCVTVREVHEKSSIPTTFSLLGHQIITTCGHCSPGLHSQGVILGVNDTVPQMKFWICLLPTSSSKLHCLFSKIMQYGLKKKVSALLSIILRVHTWKTAGALCHCCEYYLLLPLLGNQVVLQRTITHTYSKEDMIFSCGDIDDSDRW